MGQIYICKIKEIKSMTRWSRLPKWSQSENEDQLHKPMRVLQDSLSPQWQVVKLVLAEWSAEVISNLWAVHHWLIASQPQPATQQAKMVQN